MNEPKTMAELIAQVTAKFTAATNLSTPDHNQSPELADQDGVETLSQTQILHLLELGLANPSKQEDRR